MALFSLLLMHRTDVVAISFQSLSIGFIERLFRLKGNLLLYFKSTRRVRN